ncbi:SPOSA6832_00088, partial [Sporobolomyces salmonicolor]
MTKRTKKAGVTGKYGVHWGRARRGAAKGELDGSQYHVRYGATLRKSIKKMEITQHATYTCTFCGKVSSPPRARLDIH